MNHTLLTINASSNPLASTTRKLCEQVQDSLSKLHSELKLIQHDVSHGLPFINAEWIGASYTAEADRSESQRELLAMSDELIEELKAADEVIIATPMYNFSIPSGLKAWIDMVVRVGTTFHYTAEGPQGLLDDKPVILIISTGGIPLGSSMDFVTPYLKQVLKFIGITDVSVINAEGMNVYPENSLQNANNQIDQLIQQRAKPA